MYFHQAKEHTEVLEKAFRDLESLFARVETDPLLLGSQDWKSDVMVRFNLVETSATDLLLLEAPSSVYKVSKPLRFAALDYMEAVTYVRKAVEDLDVDHMETAYEYLLTGLEYTKQVAFNLQTFCD